MILENLHVLPPVAHSESAGLRQEVHRLNDMVASLRAETEMRKEENSKLHTKLQIVQGQCQEKIKVCVRSYMYSLSFTTSLLSTSTFGRYYVPSISPSFPLPPSLLSLPPSLPSLPLSPSLSSLL